MPSPISAFSSPFLRPNESYRFGFNGKEELDEMHGNSGDEYDFGARIYDARLGRWLSIDPLASKYPHLSPYNSFENNPIAFKDLTGRDASVSITGNTITITTVIYIWGQDATQAAADQFQTQINNSWATQKDGSPWTYTDAATGSVYNVKFDTQVKLYDNEEKSDPTVIPESWDPSNTDNFVEVDNNKAKAQNEDDGALAYVRNGDEGLWNTDPSLSQSIPHEFGHLLGLADRYHDDPTNPNYAVDNTGWSGNIMAGIGSNGAGSVDQRNINGIVSPLMGDYNAYNKNRNEIIQSNNNVYQAQGYLGVGVTSLVQPVPSATYQTSIDESNPSN